MTPPNASDPYFQLTALYLSLLQSQERFEEFKTLLSLYRVSETGPDDEPGDAAFVRSRLNARIREWIGASFEGLSPSQVRLWRDIVVGMIDVPPQAPHAFDDSFRRYLN